MGLTMRRDSSREPPQTGKPRLLSLAAPSRGPIPCRRTSPKQSAREFRRLLSKTTKTSLALFLTRSLAHSMEGGSMTSSRRLFLHQLGVLSGSLLLSDALAEAPPAWQSLFDGKTLQGWKRTDFGGGGDCGVEGGLLQIERGEELSGVTYTGKPPVMDYEVELEAQRRAGLDFFCGLTFPVEKKHLTLIVGGWGGNVVGISSIEREDAAHNETTSSRAFEDNRWYTIRLRVEPKRIQAWIDKDRVVDLDTHQKELDLRPGEIDLSIPLGIATFRTTAVFRNIRLRRLNA